MGIKKLKSFLAERELEPTSTALPPASHLCIDGYGFMNFIAKLMTAERFRPDLGGCYDEYALALTEYVEKLWARGVTLSVFIDGYTDLPFKGAELKIRSLSKNRNWVQMCYALNKEGCEIPDSTKFATLMKCQFMTTLKDLGITIVKCHGEAELDIARIVRVQNSIPDNKKTYFAYGDDTDFLVMDAVPYIEFEKIKFDRDEILAPVWDRLSIATSLELSEQKFVEYCLLLGNDFTHEYPASMMFSSSSSAFIKNGIRKPIEALNFVQLEPEGFQFRSFNQRLEKSLQYSRLFYDQGCDWVREEEEDDSSSDDDDDYRPEEAPTFSIPEKIRDMDFRYLSNSMYTAVGDTNPAEVLNPMNLGERVLKLLYETPTPLNDLSPGGFPTDNHLEALYQMLLLILNPETKKADMDLLLSEEITSDDMHWCDVVAATAYQKTSYAIIKKAGNIVSPKQIFNGKLFHGLMKTRFPRSRTAFELKTVTTKLKDHGKISPHSVTDLNALGNACVSLLQNSRSTEDACNLPLVTTTKRISDMMYACHTQSPDVLLTKSFLESQGDVANYILQNYVGPGRRLIVYAFEFHSIVKIKDFFKEGCFSPIVDILQVDYDFAKNVDNMNQLRGRAPIDQCQIIILTKKNDMPSLMDVNCVIDLCQQHNYTAHGAYTPSICSLDESGRRLGLQAPEMNTPPPVRFRLLPNHLVVGHVAKAIMRMRAGFNMNNIRAVINTRMAVMQRFLPAGHVFRGVFLNQEDLTKPYLVTVTFNHQFELDLCMHDKGGTTGNFFNPNSGFTQKAGVVWEYRRYNKRMEKTTVSHSIAYDTPRYVRPVMPTEDPDRKNTRHANLRTDVAAFLLRSATLSVDNNNALRTRLLDIQRLQESDVLDAPPMHRAGSDGVVDSVFNTSKMAAGLPGMIKASSCPAAVATDIMLDIATIKKLLGISDTARGSTTQHQPEVEVEVDVDVDVEDDVMDYMTEVTENDSWDFVETVNEVTKYYYFPGMHMKDEGKEGGEKIDETLIDELGNTLDDVKISETPWARPSAAGGAGSKPRQENGRFNFKQTPFNKGKGKEETEADLSEAAFRQLVYEDEAQLEEQWALGDSVYDPDRNTNHGKKKGKRGGVGTSL